MKSTRLAPMHKKLFQILLFLSFSVSWAQLTENDLYSKESDSLVTIDSLISYNSEIVNQTLVERNFSENPKEKYTGADFEYHDNAKGLSLYERFKRWLNRILKLPKLEAKYGAWVTYVAYLICAIIVFIALYIGGKFLAKEKGNFFFAKKNKTFEIEPEEIIEDIHEIDFSKIISDYELQGNFKSALRYQFLKLLKEYTDLGKINWMQEKTNTDYLHELKNPADKKHFERAVYIFDHVWYGDFNINEAAYRAFTQEFKLKPESHEQ
ncbi:DUF4129 domain-containing protein [Ornithobacterium rhinotracheale]|uniref:DUF4129 domain-containing protein n=1 Tax=Ornithobacterium rhinotracheale TaxID=28251 RepID=UPI00129C7143|nr:DUF4129 domain-containing protein [Ornithobacterium rhinotracheale]MRI62500.1 DUF4129 domain-containing protein [Ornithobacterium rhinotracheale]